MKILEIPADDQKTTWQPQENVSKLVTIDEMEHRLKEIISEQVHHPPSVYDEAYIKDATKIDDAAVSKFRSKMLPGDKIMWVRDFTPPTCGREGFDLIRGDKVVERYNAITS